MKIQMKGIYLLALLLLLSGCNKKIENIPEGSEVKNPIVIEEERKKYDLLNLEGITIESRYDLPGGFERIEESKDSFGQFLRQEKLKPYGEKVLYYDGRVKNKKGVYDSVFDVDIGDRDLHQCADAIMLLRGEYLYSKGDYNKINFNFVSGFKAEYSKWMEGYRIKVEANNVSYYKATSPLNDYKTFRKYMDMVFAYSGTLSLNNELESVEIDEIEIGDVFIIGGSPGHAVIVVDMGKNELGDKIFILAQSYMPAQETQILINPRDEELSPWYSLKDVKAMDKLITPEWTFDLDTLKRFIN